MSKLITITEAARRSGLSRWTLHRLLREGRLTGKVPGKRTIYVEETDVARCVDAFRAYVPPTDDEPDVSEDVARARSRGVR